MLLYESITASAPNNPVQIQVKIQAIFGLFSIALCKGIALPTIAIAIVVALK